MGSQAAALDEGAAGGGARVPGCARFPVPAAPPAKGLGPRVYVYELPERLTGALAVCALNPARAQRAGKIDWRCLPD